MLSGSSWAARLAPLNASWRLIFFSRRARGNPPAPAQTPLWKSFAAPSSTSTASCMSIEYQNTCPGPGRPFQPLASRRQFLQRAGGGFGLLALLSLLDRDGLLSAASAPLPKPHFAARARSVIFLFMSGGPSHVDLFDPKPELIRLAGQPIPESFGTFKTRRAVAKNKLLPPCRPFAPRGRCGMEVSDYLPHIAGCVDDICLLRGCYGDSVTHPESVYQMNTGTILMGKPSLGAWATYG